MPKWATLMKPNFNIFSVIVMLSASSLVPVCSAAGIPSEPFGKTPDGKDVTIYTLKNSSGMEARITNYGGVVVSLKVPDRNKKFDDVVLGFDNLGGYLSKEDAFFGALVGRYGNRIAKGQFTLDGHVYHLPINNGPNSLHGGTVGFNKHVWDAKDVSSSDGPALELTLVSPDGDQGYPGTLTAKVRYSLNDKNELKIEYEATTDKDTVLNLTNHSYFNLNGAGNGTILPEKLTLVADKFTPTDSGLIPTGELKSVEGTPFDFRNPTAVGSRINQNDQQLKFGMGYDQNFVLNHASGEVALAAKVEDPRSGRVLELLTDQPGVQFYTGNQLKLVHGKYGKIYRKNYALCLETQHFPDSPNHPDFPTTELKPGETFHSTTIWRFSTE